MRYSSPFGDVEIEEINGLQVIRDDKIPGGTKARILPSILDQMDAPEIVTYASPAYGYAQIALAYAARATGRHAVIFVAKRKQFHARTAEAQAAGAQIIEVPYGYLSHTNAQAAAYARSTGGIQIPFGVDLPEMRDGLRQIARSIPQPAEAWAVAGSGTLIRSLQDAWQGTVFNAVRVGSEPKAGSAIIHAAPEKFERDAKHPPPFPSCSNYDAKAWQFLKRCASPGALFWNVAA
jgi:hypothetical protein